MVNSTILASESDFAYGQASKPNTTSLSLPAEVLLIRNICIPIFIIIFVFGVFGNALTVIVLRSSRLQHTSTAIYLMALAIVDILYLLASLLITIINYTFLFPGELRHYSSLACAITPFLHYTLAYLSVWLLVAVTVDRAIWIAHPFNAKHMCTKKNAWITITFLTILLILLDSHFFWTMTYVPRKQLSTNDSLAYECQGSYFTKTIFPYIDLLLVCVLPFIFMLIGNGLIGCQLKRMRDFNRKRQQGKVKMDQLSRIPSRIPTNCANPEYSYAENPTNTANCASTHGRNAMRSKTVQHSIKNSIKNRADSKSSSLTAMLIAINVFFMITVCPLLVYDVIYFAVNLYQWIEMDETNRGVLVFGIERIVYTLWYTNFSVHFLLYCLSGPQFRVQVKRWFRSWCFRFVDFDSKTNIPCTTYNPDHGRQRKLACLTAKSQGPDEQFDEYPNSNILLVPVAKNRNNNNANNNDSENANIIDDDDNRNNASFQVTVTCYECPKTGVA